VLPIVLPAGVPAVEHFDEHLVARPGDAQPHLLLVHRRPRALTFREAKVVADAIPGNRDEPWSARVRPVERCQD